MSRRRYYSRHRISLTVRLRIDDGWLECTTIDVSRAGVFLRSPKLVAEGRIVQLQLNLPDGQAITVLGKVRRAVNQLISADTIPGIGVEFLSTSKAIRKAWDDFILGQSRHSKELAEVAPTRSNVVRHPDGQVSEKAQESMESQALRPITMRKDLDVAFLTVRPGDDAGLREFMGRRLDHPALILRTDMVVVVGQRVEIALVHFKTDAELHIHALVCQFERDPEGGRDTVTLRWPVPSQAQRRGLEHFVRTGTRGTASLGIEARRELSALRQRAFLAGEATAPWLAFAWALLDTAEATDKAAEAFLRVLGVDGDHQEALRGLALCRALQGRQGEALGLVRASRKLSPQIKNA